jgi:hypothetical protein
VILNLVVDLLSMALDPASREKAKS